MTERPGVQENPVSEPQQAHADTQKPGLTAEALETAIAGALSAFGPPVNSGIPLLEAKLMAIVERAAGQNGNGRSPVIVGPEGRSVVPLNVPSAQAIGMELLNAIRVSLQTQRITLVAVRELARRLQLAGAGGLTVGSVRAAATSTPPVPDQP